MRYIYIYIYIVAKLKFKENFTNAERITVS